VARYRRGVPRGLAVATFNDQVVWAGHLGSGGMEEGPTCSRCWESGGLLLGEGVETGDKMTYVYPDMTTALVGDFFEGRMVWAKEAMVTSITIMEDLPSVTWTQDPTGPSFSYSPSTKDTFGPSDRLLRDPFETRQVLVRRSLMECGGEGMFARVSLPPGATAAVFNGFKVPLGESSLAELVKEAEEAVYDRLAYTIHMPQEEDFFLDIPPSQADLRVYCGSLGHKVNHSFLPNCDFGTMYHPRWGRVRTIRTLRAVVEGEELLVDYGYDLIRCPAWFRHTFTRELGHKYAHYLDFKRP